MPELLLELGMEELPASAVRDAYEQLRHALHRALNEIGMLDETGQAMGTPRRLIVSFANVAARQADSQKEQRGPSMKAAYDAQGAPSQALLGFCRSQGVEPSGLRNDGEYVWISKLIPGRDAREILGELIPKAIRALSFDKTMRWGTGRMRFARPIRWILASFDGEVVPFELEGVSSGLQSRGHRFYAPEKFEASSLQELVAELRKRCVEPDPNERRMRIVAQASEIADGVPEMTEALVEENVFLTEWPTAISGAFREEFQYLPEAVLITAMAKHEKMFPVRDAHHTLTNRFVFIRNSGEDETVRRGSEWVLNARFNDAKFFFDEDRKYSLAEFLEKTGGILFQDKLGTVRARADRLSRLCQTISRNTGGTVEEIDLAQQAGLYAKADLSTGLVSELSSLQGVIGAEYAKAEGLPDAVCHALASQYDLTKIPAIDSCATRTAARLIMADQIDKLAGYLGLGLIPNGSSDPFALRRASTQLIEIAWLWPTSMPSLDLFLEEALSLYAEQGVPLDSEKAFRAFWELLAGRYEALLDDARYDLLEAALRERIVADVSLPRTVRFRLKSLERVIGDTPTVQTATRPLNIIAAAKKKGLTIPDLDFDADWSRLESTDGDDLLKQTKRVALDVLLAESVEDDEGLIQLLLSLMDPINRFFGSTMVMADDPAVRDARLALLARVCQLLLVAGDWSKIVIEG